MPPLSGHGEWAFPKARRHLRLRQVERPAPEAMIQAAAIKQRQQQQQQEKAEQQKQQQQRPSEKSTAALAAGAHEDPALQHVQAAGHHTWPAGHQMQAAAADAATTAAAALQRAEQAALGNTSVAGVQRQLASLQHLTQHQLANLAEAARHARQQLAARMPGRQQAAVDCAPQQQRQQAAQMVAAGHPGAAGAASMPGLLSTVRSGASRSAHALSAQVQQQVAGLQQAGQQLQARLQHTQAASRRRQRQAAAAPTQQRAQAAAQQQPAAAQPQPAQRTASARHVAAAQPVAPPPSQGAPLAGLGRFALAWLLGAAASALLLLRLLRTRRRKARAAQEAIRWGTQPASAAVLLRSACVSAHAARERRLLPSLCAARGLQESAVLPWIECAPVACVPAATPGSMVPHPVNSCTHAGGAWPAPCCRGAEQRARAAKLYDRQRQRFQRALLAAEDLEGADSSVFTAVSRKGSANGAAAVPNAADASSSGAGAGEADGIGNPFLREVPGSAAAAAAAALATADAEEEEDQADVFDPASWDDDVRRQWESFVSSSKVRSGRCVPAGGACAPS